MRKCEHAYDALILQICCSSDPGKPAVPMSGLAKRNKNVYTLVNLRCLFYQDQSAPCGHHCLFALLLSEVKMYRAGLGLTRRQGTISRTWDMEDPVEHVSVFTIWDR